MNPNVISSPTPGIFWHRPDPDSEPFLVDGQTVEVGQKIGVIEVMKMFIDVQADRAGTFKRYVAENGESVPMGATLVELGDA